MSLLLDPVSNLMLPRQFVDEKQSLKKSIEDWVDRTVNEHQRIEGSYFLTFHAKFDPQDPSVFKIDAPKITKKIPPFLSNTLVYWICNKRGIRELLWMVAPKKPKEKLKVEFNTSGVAYLQAKGAMPS